MRSLFTMSQILVFCLIFQGCQESSRQPESVADQIGRCAKVFEKVGDHDEDEDGEEEEKDKNKSVDKKEVEKCRKMFEELAPVAVCLKRYDDSPADFYRCAAKKLNSDKKDTGKDTKKDTCERLHGRMMTCFREMDESESMMKELSDRKKFVKECLAHYEEAEKMIHCVDKPNCGEFFKCFMGVDPMEMKKEAEKLKARTEADNEELQKIGQLKAEQERLEKELEKAKEEKDRATKDSQH